MIFEIVKPIIVLNFLFCFRWNNTPLSESVRFRQPAIAKYLKEYIKDHPDQGLVDEYAPEEDDYN